MRPVILNCDLMATIPQKGWILGKKRQGREFFLIFNWSKVELLNEKASFSLAWKGNESHKGAYSSFECNPEQKVPNETE